MTNTCDWNHWGKFEVRLLPTGGGGNIILCRQHYLHEMQYRRERNLELGLDNQFDLPAWDELKVYGLEE